jgi:hypothetical protein
LISFEQPEPKSPEKVPSTSVKVKPYIETSMEEAGMS